MVATCCSVCGGRPMLESPACHRSDMTELAAAFSRALDRPVSYVDRVRPGQLIDVPDVRSWVAEHGGDDPGDVVHGDGRGASRAERQRDRAVFLNRPRRHRW